MDEAWPELRVDEWQDTRDTFQLWTQIVGKVRMVHTPRTNHWWNVPLYVGSSGLTTSLIPYGHRSFQVDFDLLHDRLDVLVAGGERGSMALRPMTVADFHAEFMGLLDELDLHTEIWNMPVEIADAIPFDRDDVHRSYDGDALRRFWTLLVSSQRVFDRFRSEFIGKASPVHLFWGALDLATTRFSGRSAPPHPGGAPNCGPEVMHEAYSQEVSSAGYWPGGADEGVFYSYAYPEPVGFRDIPVSPEAARWDDDLAEFVLPYSDLRTSADPDAALLEFLRSTYAAAADAAAWDRATLER